MKILETALKGVLMVEPRVFRDNRGYFMEIYHQKRYDQSGIRRLFVQDNLSYSVRGTLRGLHYQLPHPQAKLVEVIRGEIFDVVVDIRRGSPTFGHWIGIPLSEKNKRQLFVSEGFAHGFCVLSEEALVIYRCSDFYAPDSDNGILWSDPALAIEWPVANPLLSEKDARYPLLEKVPFDRLPLYGG
jgi:dTDP-4-dehydrorhamnose 3,5-epimerase